MLIEKTAEYPHLMLCDICGASLSEGTVADKNLVKIKEHHWIYETSITLCICKEGECFTKFQGNKRKALGLLSIEEAYQNYCKLQKQLQMVSPLSRKIIP